jgi:hypothetical protein
VGLGRAAAVFISYRRDDTGGQARALQDRLARQYPDRPVFMDVDAIAPGVDFVEHIEHAIAGSAVLLALIGHDWLAPEGDGTRRLDDPTDFVRLEITAALQRRIPLIPFSSNGPGCPGRRTFPNLCSRWSAFRRWKWRTPDGSTTSGGF